MLNSSVENKVLTDVEIAEQRITKLFKLGVFIKGLNSIVEIIGGFLLFLVPLDIITRFTVWVTQEELTDDPHDFIANYIFHLGNDLSVSSTTFGGIYLMSHGIIKIGLVISLLKGKMWSYPLAISVLSIFVVYQTYRFVHTYAIGLLLLTIFDLIVIWLIASEYKNAKKRVLVK